MRLFIALTLPARERKRIHRAGKVLRERDLPVRWIDPDNYHVTLKFLGSVEPPGMERMRPELEEAASKSRPFEMGISGFGAFPSIRRPQVLWVGAEASPALRCLKQDIEFSLSQCGFERETRAFHPHVTIGRTRDSGGAGDFRGLDEIAAGIGYQGSVSVKSIALMRSRLLREGPRYSVVSTIPLGSPEGG